MDWLSEQLLHTHTKKKKKPHRRDMKSETIQKLVTTPRYAHTAAPALTWDLLVEHLVTSSWGKSSNYWHYCHWSLQPYSSQPFLQTRALSAVTARVYHICLSPRWSRAMTEWPTTVLTFPDLCVYLYYFLPCLSFSLSVPPVGAKSRLQNKLLVAADYIMIWSYCINQR